jgi:proline iminopeptidase
MRYFVTALLTVFVLQSCHQEQAPPIADQSCSYLQSTTPGDYQSGGVRMIALREGYKVWTKRHGNSPMKVLILHGGPAGTHEYLECFQSFFPQANIEFYEYDQLGSYRSDQPTDMSLYTIERFVEEVEQVRVALGLDSTDFFLLGHSWGGILALEYALKYQQNIKGLIVSNMTADFHRYAAYNNKLREELRPTLVDTLKAFEDAEDYGNPLYLELVEKEFYAKHICRIYPFPEPVARSFRHFNMEVYAYMQGPSEFVPGGILKDWTVWDRLKELRVPTLTIGARYDSMNPEEMEEMAELVQNGQYLHCPNGSHMALWDDQQVYMSGVVGFIQGVGNGKQ